MHADRPPLGIAVLPARPVDGPAVVVVAEMPQHLRHAGPSGRRQEAAAGVVPGFRPVARLGVLEGGPEVEAAARLAGPPPLRDRVGLDAGGRLVPVVADRGEVRDRRPAKDPTRDPVAARRLQDPRGAGVRDDEAVVVEAAASVLRASPLAVAFEEVCDDALDVVRGPAALEAESEEVHAQETSLGRRLARVERLVPDRHAGRVDPVLEPPDPPGAASQDAQGLGRLGDLQVRAADRAPRCVAAGRHRLERLALRRRAAVLREEGAAARRLRAEGDERVAASVHAILSRVLPSDHTRGT
jgi:hypothetical protein